MEILIVGVVLVALMVFVSTKIKKSAAAAFEREVIDTKDFIIFKPEGLINPLNNNSQFAFEAYSKEFGKNDAEEFNQMTAHLRVFSNANFKEICRNAKKSVSEIISENLFVTDTKQTVYLLEGRNSEKGARIFKTWKIVYSIQRRRVYELQISILDNYREAYAERQNEMLESFTIK